MKLGYLVFLSVVPVLSLVACDDLDAGAAGPLGRAPAGGNPAGVAMPPSPSGSVAGGLTAGAGAGAAAGGGPGSAPIDGTGSTGAAAGSTPPQQGPDGSAFYTPPSPLPNGAHGDLVRYRPATLAIPNAPAFSAWTVMYHSTDAVGKGNVVTGTVIVPKAASAQGSDRPIITFAIGTHGLSQKCIPSLQLVGGKEYEGANIAKGLHEGFAIVVSDYPGYTTGAKPAYMVGKANGQAVLDIVTAALQIPGVGLSKSAKVGIWGYSQGGQSAPWAGQLQPTYAPHINLIGVAAGGVPADFLRVAPYLDGHNGAAFLFSTVLGLWNQYPDKIPLMELINDQGQEAAKKAEDMCVIEAMFAFMNTKLSSFTQGSKSLEDMIAIPSVREVLAEQTLGNSPIRAPVLLYHATGDEFIPLEQSLDLKQKYCALGVDTTYLAFPGEHFVALFQAGPHVLSWFKDRLAGAANRSTCDTSSPKPVPNPNPIDGDYVVSLKQWSLDARVHLAGLDQDVQMPKESTLTADANMTAASITGDASIPPFSAPISILVDVNVDMKVRSSEPLKGTTSIDNDGQLHVNGLLYAHIEVATLADLLPVSCVTETPVAFPIKFDGSVSALGGGMTFTGTTTFPPMTCGDDIISAATLTTLMSGEGQTFAFTIDPPGPTTW